MNLSTTMNSSHSLHSANCSNSSRSSPGTFRNCKSIPSHTYTSTNQQQVLPHKACWKRFSSPFLCNSEAANGKEKHSPPIVPSLTSFIVEAFKKAEPSYVYDCRQNPKRVLTKPSKGTKNHGWDNEDSDYILYVGDIVGFGAPEEGRSFLVMDILGHGTFGQVVKCKHLLSGKLVAVKIIKNEQAYFNQSLMEVTILEMLNKRYDPADQHHVTRMLDTFVFRSHLCIVFELLSLNLYELLKQNRHKGFSHSLIQRLLTQILDALCLLKEAKIVHCDLKPENILLKRMDSPEIKVIDFGSGCHENKTVYTYIQSRFYRSPEVILGLPYTSAIDMWSFGCIAMELFLGLPLFPGNSNYDQIKRICESLGQPPSVMMEIGKEVPKYFVKGAAFSTSSGKVSNHWHLKSKDLFEKEYKCTIGDSKRYFSGISIEEIINLYPMSKKKTACEQEREKQLRAALCDLVKGALNLNPLERWTPQQAKKHPYLTGEPFLQPFDPIASLMRSVEVPSVSRLQNTSGSSIGNTANSLLNRPRAMTINAMKPQAPVPPSLERVAEVTGGIQATIPTIGERHYSIIAAENSSGSQNRRNRQHQQQLHSQGQSADVAINTQHQPQLTAQQQTATNYSLLIEQRRISNPYGNYLPISITNSLHRQQQQKERTNAALGSHNDNNNLHLHNEKSHQQLQLPSQMITLSESSTTINQQPLSTQLPAVSVGLDGYRVSRRDSIPLPSIPALFKGNAERQNEDLKRRQRKE